MKKAIVILSIIFTSFYSNATIHIVKVWNGYFQFLDRDITIQLGDTVQWLPLDVPSMVHTITSTNIPTGAVAFDQIWQAPADTFFQYIPQIAGLYEYECTPHVLNGMTGSITVMGWPTSISENEVMENNTSVYPNPATNYIDFRGSNTGSSYKIYAVTGEVASFGITLGPVNISTLSKGTYFIEIIGDKPRTIKFIKL